MEEMNKHKLLIMGKAGEETFALDNEEPVELDLFGEAVGLEIQDPIFES